VLEEPTPAEPAGRLDKAGDPYGPDGKYSEDPEVLAAAFTRFENHEGLSSLF
jgi:hypothetical protein